MTEEDYRAAVNQKFALIGWLLSGAKKATSVEKLALLSGAASLLEAAANGYLAEIGALDIFNQSNDNECSPDRIEALQQPIEHCTNPNLSELVNLAMAEKTWLAALIEISKRIKRCKLKLAPAKDENIIASFREANQQSQNASESVHNAMGYERELVLDPEQLQVILEEFKQLAERQRESNIEY